MHFWQNSDRIRNFTECGKRIRPRGKNIEILSEYGRYVSRKAKVHFELNLARDIKTRRASSRVPVGKGRLKKM